MSFIADLHLHGRFSRGCSTALTIQNLEKWGRIKGLGLLGSGDFTHPQWFEELKTELVREQDGIYYTSTDYPFMLQTEISLIYSADGKGRRIHNVVLAPSLDVVEQITEALLKRGRVDYDGRPIFKLPGPDFVEMLRQISTDIEVIPAHVWTPHFSLFGDYNQYNKVEDCFKDQTKHINALETGMSSDPAMNWRLSQLDDYQLVSFSDSHSFWPWRIGREATVFETKLTYQDVLKAIRTRQGLKETIEVDPNYGKYHFDGHRNCNVCLSPAESLKNNNRCPVCGKPLTIGVEHRIEQLADRELGFKPKNAVPYRTIIPLSEIISTLSGKGIATKGVWQTYNKLISAFKNENNILLSTSKEELIKTVDEKLAELIIKNREGKIKVKPGYDGVYGVPLIGKTKPVEPVASTSPDYQKGLNQFL
ncbi:DNA helicase UvrD [Candidatus Woesearchaeota archaeon]|nr:DNA helicase UvrD [Candidatus Woesearchaeota archaeon]